MTFSLSCNKISLSTPRNIKKKNQPNFSRKMVWMDWEVFATENGVPQVTADTEVETL